MRAVVVDSAGQISVAERPDPVLPGPRWRHRRGDRQRHLRIGPALPGGPLPPSSTPSPSDMRRWASSSKSARR